MKACSVVASVSSLVVPLPAGVPAQETAPAKLMVYLQRFRPQDYQRLLEANVCSEATGDSTS